MRVRHTGYAYAGFCSLCTQAKNMLLDHYPHLDSEEIKCGIVNLEGRLNDYHATIWTALHASKALPDIHIDNGSIRIYHDNVDNLAWTRRLHKAKQREMEMED